MESRTLKVGDPVIRACPRTGKSVKYVERVTKTQAILNDGTRLQVKSNGNSLRRVGAWSYGAPIFSIATPEEAYEARRAEEASALVSDIEKSLANVPKKSSSVDTLRHVDEVLKRLLKKP